MEPASIFEGQLFYLTVNTTGFVFHLDANWVQAPALLLFLYLFLLHQFCRVGLVCVVAYEAAQFLTICASGVVDVVQNINMFSLRKSHGSDHLQTQGDY